MATQRNAFLRSKKEDALALIKHIEENNYRKFAEVTAADLNKAADAERAKIENIKANVADGAPDGFGIALLKNGSPILCLAVGAKVQNHGQLLVRAEGKLNLEMQTEVVITDTTIDERPMKKSRMVLCFREITLHLKNRMLGEYQDSVFHIRPHQRRRVFDAEGADLCSCATTKPGSGSGK